MKRLGLSLVPLSLALFLGVLFASGAGAAPKASYPGLAAPKIVALLELQHPRGLNRFVRAVSDPDSARYRDYASVEQLVARYGAKKQTQKKVLRWLAARGVRGEVSATGTYVTAKLPRRLATRILPPAAGASISATGLAPAVPVGLRDAATAIALLSTEPVVETTAGTAAKNPAKPFRSLLPHTGTSTGCLDARTGGHEPGPDFQPFTPNQYLTAYGHAEMHKRGFKGQGQVAAVVETGGFRHSDIATFAKCFGLKPPPIKVVPIGSGKPLPPQDETTLDLEMLTAGAPGLERINVYEAAGSMTELIAAAGAALGNPANRPDVISISLGFCEPSLSGQLYVREAFDNVFAVAAGAGISVLVSAGDEGSSGCRAFSTETKVRTALPVPAVSVPSSSAYATAVGGTNLELTKTNRIKQQLVWNDSVAGLAGGGGGGTSILSLRTPWWQTAGQGYGVGRKVPDLSALADVFPGYAIFCTAAEGCLEGDEPVPGWTSFGGTSAAAPLTAAGIVLANQYADRHGEPNLGFLNPLLYDLGAEQKAANGAFYDVVNGNNDVGRALPKDVGGGVPLGCCSAKPGYDWASGWGSIKVPGFSEAASRAAP